MSKKNPTFEENLQRLEQIVQAMEQGDVPLAESMKLFQEGTDLVRKCQDMLDSAQLLVNTVTADEDGMPVEESFDAEF